MNIKILKKDVALIAEDEVFKPVVIDGEVYHGYWISSYGRCYSEKSGKFIKQRISKDCRIEYKLYKNGKDRYLYANRLVAFAHVTNPNPEEFNVVHHIDENPLNNKHDNLMWTTQKYNLNVGTVQKRRAKTMSRVVIQLDLDGFLIAKYSSMNEAARQTGLYVATIFRGCNDGEVHKGYYWKYESGNQIKRTGGKKKVEQYNSDGKLIASYDSIRETARQFDVGVGSVYNWCKSDRMYRGFYWKCA